MSDKSLDENFTVSLTITHNRVIRSIFGVPMGTRPMPLIEVDFPDSSLPRLQERLQDVIQTTIDSFITDQLEAERESRDHMNQAMKDMKSTVSVAKEPSESFEPADPSKPIKIRDIYIDKENP